MSEPASSFSLPGSRPDSLTLVTSVGQAQGSKAAAAALACAGADRDRPGLLIDLAAGRSPRPGLIASGSARALEERLAVHLPEAGVASCGWICRLSFPPADASLGHLGGVVAIGRGLAVVVNLPPELLQSALVEPGLEPSGALLRADLRDDRPLAALVSRGLLARGLKVAILKRPAGWLASRRALAGALPPEAAGGLPARIRRQLLDCGVP